MYLLTNKPVTAVDPAWRMVLRRWQVEMSFRFTKTELAMQSPRLGHWHTRLKWLMLVALVYAFLLSLVVPQLCTSHKPTAPSSEDAALSLMFGLKPFMD